MHKLVAMFFLSSSLESQPVVYHINGITWDNTVHNLKWVSTKENYEYRHGTLVQVIEQGSNITFNFLSVTNVIAHYDLKFKFSRYTSSNSDMLRFEHEGKKFLIHILVS